jgi:hypothetical protein
MQGSNRDALHLGRHIGTGDWVFAGAPPHTLRAYLR